MTRGEVHEIFRKIAIGERKHGGFLTAFAEAMMRADSDNLNILQPAAHSLIAKYALQSYAAPSRDGGLR